MDFTADPLPLGISPTSCTPPTLGSPHHCPPPSWKSRLSSLHGLSSAVPPSLPGAAAHSLHQSSQPVLLPALACPVPPSLLSPSAQPLTSLSATRSPDKQQSYDLSSMSSLTSTPRSARLLLPGMTSEGDVSFPDSKPIPPSSGFCHRPTSRVLSPPSPHSPPGSFSSFHKHPGGLINTEPPQL